jgi:hypothetical protein
LEKPTFWEVNSSILIKQYPGLLEEIVRQGDEQSAGELKIEAAASGVPTAAMGGLYVHSARDPEREGKRLAEATAAEGTEPGPVVILGFGLGYAAQALAELAPQRPIIIVEKNLRLLRKALELRDFSRLLSRPGVAFIPGGCGEGISGVLSFFEKTSGERYAPCIMRNRTLTALDEQWYASVENRIHSWAMRDDVNTATLKKFGRRWIRNLSRNMSAIRDLPGISRLAGLAAYSESSDEPLPVFLAAAGPGLDSAAPLLAEIHQRCIVVAVDTSLRFLLRNGVDPDFTLVVDPQFWNSRHLNRCVSPHTRIIAESAVYPPVLRFPFRGAYLCGSLYPLGSFIEQRVDPKGDLGAGGSVATSAWDFSRILGARQIWIAGLDLAFPGLKTHFRGAQFEEKALAESVRLNPAETWLLHALRGGIPFYAPSISGGQVLTDRRLSLYAAWFENRFSQFPAIRNYSLSSGSPPTTGGASADGAATGGLAIAGLEPAETKTILALPERRAEINQKLEAAFLRIETEFFELEEARRRSERYENAVTALSSGLRQIQNACEKGRKTAEQALSRDTGPAGREKTLAALDEINRFITGSEVKEIAGFLFPPEILAEMGKTGQSADADAAFHAYLKSSVRLYRSLEESAEISAH